MSGVMICIGACCGCGAVIHFHPDYVPSLRVARLDVPGGTREPLCRGCFDRWNTLHRTSQGLEPVPLHPDAYSDANCE